MWKSGSGTAQAANKSNALRGSVPVIQSDNLPWMEVQTMSSKDEIRIGGIAVRYLVEGHEANNTVAMFEFDVAPGSKVPGPHSHDGYEETVYGLEGTRRRKGHGGRSRPGPRDSSRCRASLRKLSSHHRNSAHRHYSRHPRPQLLPRSRRPS